MKSLRREQRLKLDEKPVQWSLASLHCSLICICVQWQHATDGLHHISVVNTEKIFDKNISENARKYLLNNEWYEEEYWKLSRKCNLDRIAYDVCTTNIPAHDKTLLTSNILHSSTSGYDDGGGNGKNATDWGKLSAADHRTGVWCWLRLEFCSLWQQEIIVWDCSLFWHHLVKITTIYTHETHSNIIQYNKSNDILQITVNTTRLNPKFTVYCTEEGGCRNCDLLHKTDKMFLSGETCVTKTELRMKNCFVHHNTDKHVFRTSNFLDQPGL